MIKTRKLFSAVVALAFTVGMVACSDGEEGPAGKDGNANVKAYTFTVDNSDWERGNTSTFEYSLSAINADVVNGGAVMGYVRAVDSGNDFVGDEWVGLPYSKVGFIAVNGQPATITIGYGYDSGEINLSLFASANLPLPETIPSATGGQIEVPGDLEFKFVVIPSAGLVDGVSKDATFEELTQVYNFETIEL